jgi:hypothetical protein
MLAVPALMFVLQLAPRAAAAPLCAAGLNTTTSLASQIAQGACEFNGYTFTFQAVNAVNTAAPGSNANTIDTNTRLVLTASGALDMEVQYFANGGGKSFGASFPGGTFLYKYDVTPLNPAYGIIGSVYTVANANETSAGRVFGFENVTGTGAQSGGVIDLDSNPATFENLVNTLSFSAMQGTIHVSDNLSLVNLGRTFGYVGNVDHPGSLRNELNFINTAVPEPVSVLLSGIGLLALGFCGRRTKKS